MSIISWNSRGAGHSSKIEELSRKIKSARPFLVFVCETKCGKQKSEQLLRHFKDFDHYVVPSEGLSGGLWLLWLKNAPFQLEVLVTDCWIIHCQLSYDATQWNGLIPNVGLDTDFTEMMLLSFVYGSGNPKYRHVQWQCFKSLKPVSDMPWLTMGDFNEVVDQSEKIGGKPFHFTQAKPFLDLIDDCGFSDLGFIGSTYTWNNKQIGQRRIWERIDRGMANLPWMCKFPQARVFHDISTTSDHKFLVLKIMLPERLQKPFRFEEMWIYDDSCKDVIVKEFEGNSVGSPGHVLTTKLKKCSISLKKWNWQVFGHIDRKLEHLKHCIEVVHKKILELGPTNSIQVTELHEEEFRLYQDFNESLMQQAKHWRQKSTMEWFQLGDIDTKFFHGFVRQRRQQNFIHRIKNELGEFVSDRTDIGNQFLNYFKSIMSRRNVVLADDLFDLNTPVLNEIDCVNLMLPVSSDEIFKTVRQLKALKSPGPDGFQPLFFHKFWEEVGEYVCNTVKHFFSTGTFPLSLNHSFIVLIPKCNNPISPENFRPISLSNTVYKVIAKIMVNRMRPLMKKLISPFQSAFLPKRSIHDNILLANEFMHKIRSPSNRKAKFFGLKIDMQKAYDQLEWPFLQKTLTLFRFPQEWIDKIRFCVEKVSYSLLLNGSAFGYFTPTRGIRQGDPLSPYLFILCSEILSLNFIKLQNQGVIQGFKLGRQCDPVSTIMYADDLLVFGKCGFQEQANISKILTEYCSASGQTINKKKSEILHHPKLHRRFVSFLKRSFQMKTTPELKNYLGAPSLLGRGQVEKFNDLIGKFHARLAGWKAKVISRTGRLTLVNSVLSALPSHVMSCCLLPAKVIDHVDKIRRAFFWGHTTSERKLHYFNWELACTPNCLGGLGIRDIQLQNYALLAKKAFELIYPKSLWALQMKNKYFPTGNFLDAKVKSGSSIMWKSLCKIRGILLAGLKWKICNGEKVSIWYDSWVPNFTPRMIVDSAFTDEADYNQFQTVAQLIDQNTKSWDWHVVSSLWPVEISRIICSTPLSKQTSSDRIIWNWHKSGVYVVKSAYKEWWKEAHSNSLSLSQDMQKVFSAAWKLNLPQKIKFFWWQCLQGVVPTM